MPDTHLGYGMPIGGVMATTGTIVPNAVGVDIGCGMVSVKTSLTEINADTLKKIMGQIRNTVPVGFAHHKESQEKHFTVSNHDAYVSWNGSIVEQEWKSALTQVGTLGSGNHFIEIQLGDDNHIWIMVHSGSRNIGLKVASYYNKLAKTLNEKWHTSVPEKWDLAFLPLDDTEGHRYFQEMKFCVEFAFANRKLMMDRIMTAFGDNVADIKFDPMINIAHNYARLEHHFGKNVVVHRKGATSAREEEIGIIPGSQGSSSFIVQGLGSVESFESCSHGAGRKMGREAAKKNLNLETEIKMLNDKGIIHAIRHVSDLDEAPSAYKSIDVVMAEQVDLVKPLIKLEPLAVIKG